MANRLPERPDPSRLPAERTLTQEQFEMVIRRAAELQARAAEDPGGGGLSETKTIRIGREIGISPQHLRRALAETGSAPLAPPTAAERIFGPGWVTASRTVPGNPAEVKGEIDSYLVRRERLAPIRRFPDRTTYGPARGGELAQAVQTFRETLFSQRQQPMVGAGFKLKSAREVEVGVQGLEEGYAYVTLAADLRNVRTGNAAAGIGLGGGIATAAALVLGIAVDPAAALIGAPMLPGAIWGFRALQVHTAAHAQTHLESILDCLERNEPLVLERY